MVRATQVGSASTFRQCAWNASQSRAGNAAISLAAGSFSLIEEHAEIVLGHGPDHREAAMHDQGVDEAELGVAKRAGDAPDGRKPERRPEMDRALIGRDYEVELHRGEPGFGRGLQRMFAQRTRDALVPRLGRHHVPGVGDVIARAPVGWAGACSFRRRRRRALQRMPAWDVPSTSAAPRRSSSEAAARRHRRRRRPPGRSARRARTRPGGSHGSGSSMRSRRELRLRDPVNLGERLAADIPARCGFRRRSARRRDNAHDESYDDNEPRPSAHRHTIPRSQRDGGAHLGRCGDGCRRRR